VTITRAGLLFCAFMAGVLMALLGGVVLRPARAEVEPPPTITATIQHSATSTPRPTATARPTRTPIPTATTKPIQLQAAGGQLFGWPGEVQCYNCSPFTSHIQVHHYDPNLGDMNCFLWDEDFDYCMSATASMIPWESVWGFAAACPREWSIGTWLDIPGVGAFICFDRGDLIYCTDDGRLCTVDLLGPGGAEWDGKEFDITLWVPLKPRKEN